MAPFLIFTSSGFYYLFPEILLTDCSNFSIHFYDLSYTYAASIDLYAQIQELLLWQVSLPSQVSFIN